MASLNIELNNKPIKGSNEHNLLLRITINRKHTRISLMYNVLPSQFNANGKKSNYIRSNHPDYRWLNEKLDDKIKQTKEIISDLEKKGKPVSGHIIRNLLIKPKSTDFFKYMENHIKELEENYHFSTAEKYHVVLESLKSYTRKEDLLFNEISLDFINSYENYLIKEEKAKSTIHGMIKNIKALFNRAIQRGIIDHGESPFIGYRLKLGKISKDRLNEEEIKKLEKFDFRGDMKLDNARNAFLFSYYNAGIRISDILMLTWKNIVDDRLIYQMYKTDKVHSLKLKEKPLAILKKYQDSGESFLFPYFSDKYDYSDRLFLHKQIGAKTALINRYLKDVAGLIGFKKNITTHTARHTFADLARHKTDNLYNLSKALGHSSLKVTEGYLASFDDQAVDDTLDKMFDEQENKVPVDANDKLNE